ncbi:Glycoprotein-N-acetylgalactosamine 3-beta-galactosyltransferase 1 [Strongyloides ratti]|uniref:Glycoprotein-N-acetylgalactosamine 3-beta-galactosyltransferase 1 n=1 Tax=Strongyloides ratti TaxID=34506 RepID=A0A090MXU3_STRRB|nr:Glycoprotein-N-acetylgalactosamine 3-beta-galactosyltransferase 1 [Strongyloides ratti]CEF66034.1 Glycoprotein-N-acetylgalactosamine 3-beta-galactosyltransferase 1 [Strongyloides ratti]
MSLSNGSYSTLKVCCLMAFTSVLTIFVIILLDYSNFSRPLLIENYKTNKVYEVNQSQEYQDSGNLNIVEKISKRVRIFCYILSSEKYHKTRSIHVKATWAKRCNKYIFMSSLDDPSLPSINLNVTESKDHLWEKTKRAFKYIYENDFNDYDWFLKSDDDTYVVMENLRFMLMNYSPNTPIYFGCKFKPFVKQGYMSGGAGYVLSKEAVRRFVTEGLPDPQKCRSDQGGSEDIEMGKCLQNVGVVAGDSRDSNGYHRFFPLQPNFYLNPTLKYNDFWIWKYTYYPMKTGKKCCNDYTISFHYIDSNLIYVMDYLIYNLRPFGQFSEFDKNLILSGRNESIAKIENEILENAYKLSRKVSRVQEI